MTTATATAGRANWLKRIWNRLPNDEWLTEPAFDELLIEATNSPGDYAFASAVRTTLVNARAVEVRQRGGREYEYRRGEWTDWPENGPGSEAYNAELQRQHREHEEIMRQRDELQRQRLADSPLGVQRRQILELIDQAVDARLRPLEETVAQLLTQLNGTAPKVAAEYRRRSRIAGRRSDNNE